MKLVYVVAPFGGENAWEAELNVRRAEEVGLAVAEAGAIPVIAHTMYRYYGAFGKAFWLQCAVALLVRCDAVIICEGPAQDAAMRIQLKEADRLSLERFSDSDFIALRDWARK